MKTKTAAIRHARANVTLSNTGAQWRVDIYSPDHRAWRQGHTSNYWQARANYAQQCINKARSFQGLPDCQYGGGAWTSYIVGDEPDSIADELLNALRNVTHPMAGDEELQDALSVIAKAEGRGA